MKNLFILSLLIVISCSSRAIKEPAENQITLDDNAWLTEDVLQLYVEESAGNDLSPETLKRERACEAARKKLNYKLGYLYPDWQNVKFEKRKVSNVYFQGGTCRVYYHLSAVNLKNKFKGNAGR